MWTGEAILKGAAERSRVMAECSADMYVRMRERETNLVSPSLHSCSGSQREHEAFHWTCGEEVCPLQTRRKQCTAKTCHLPPTTHTHTHTYNKPTCYGYFKGFFLSTKPVTVQFCFCFISLFKTHGIHLLVFLCRSLTTSRHHFFFYHPHLFTLPDPEFYCNAMFVDYCV